MTRCRTFIVGLLLVGSAYSQGGFNYDSNPYLSNGYVNDVNAFLADQQRQTRMDLSGNPFLQHMIEGAASAQNALFAGPEYLPPVDKKSVVCNGAQVCVPRNQCSNGYFSQGPGGSRKDCDADSEVCCSYRPPQPRPTQPPPSQPRQTPPPYRPNQTPEPYRPNPTPPPYRPNQTPEPYRPNPTPPPYRPNPPPQRPQGQPCTGNNFSCVSPALCVNGVIKSNGFLKSAGAPKSSSQCFAPEVCCRVPEPESTVLNDDGYHVRVPERPFPSPSVPRPFVQPSPRPYQPPSQAPTYLPPPQPTRRPFVPDRVPQPSNPNPTRIPPARGEDQLSQPIHPRPNRPNFDDVLPPTKCAAALNCTEISFCTATGFMSKTPVILTPDQELFRVPMTDCMMIDKGIIGKCCRDPDYVDPWPVSQLGQYNAEVFGNNGKYTPNQKPQRQPQAQATVGQAILSLPINPPRQNSISSNPFKVPSHGQCISRNTNGSPKGPGPYDAAFSEYPWQVMILQESSKSLLCGGAIIGDDLIATAAHCVDGRKPFDVLIKAGEWKLGRDEEPLDFQINRVKKIEVHPGFEPNTLKNDMALLHLDSKLKFDAHIAPICVDDKEPSPSDDCVTTGWGKQALKAHAQDAVMHHSPVSVLPAGDCTKQADGYHYESGGSVCGKTSIDACELDSGSALACANGKGQYVMKGVYSAEDRCGSASQIVTFAKPDMKFINAAKSKTPYQPQPSPSIKTSTSAPLYLPPRY